MIQNESKLPFKNKKIGTIKIGHIAKVIRGLETGFAVPKVPHLIKLRCH